MVQLAVSFFYISNVFIAAVGFSFSFSQFNFDIRVLCIKYIQKKKKKCEQSAKIHSAKMKAMKLIMTFFLLFFPTKCFVWLIWIQIELKIHIINGATVSRHSEKTTLLSGCPDHHKNLTETTSLIRYLIWCLWYMLLHWPLSSYEEFARVLYCYWPYVNAHCAYSIVVVFFFYYI